MKNIDEITKNKIEERQNFQEARFNKTEGDSFILDFYDDKNFASRAAKRNRNKVETLEDFCARQSKENKKWIADLILSQCTKLSSVFTDEETGNPLLRFEGRGDALSVVVNRKFRIGRFRTLAKYSIINGCLKFSGWGLDSENLDFDKFFATEHSEISEELMEILRNRFNRIANLWTLKKQEEPNNNLSVLKSDDDFKQLLQIKKENSEAIPLKQGQRISIGDYTKYIAQISWTQSNIDNNIDFSVFLLGNDEKVLQEEDFVFYNNRSARDGLVYLYDGQELNLKNKRVAFIDFSKYISDIEKFSFCLSVYHNKNTLSDIDNIYFEIICQDRKILSFPIPKNYNINNRSIIIGNLYKKNNQWRFNAIGAGYKEGLERLCQEYGLEVE